MAPSRTQLTHGTEPPPFRDLSDPDEYECRTGHTQGRVGNDYDFEDDSGSRPCKHFTILVFDPRQLDRFFLSVADAKVMAEGKNYNFATDSHDEGLLIHERNLLLPQLHDEFRRRCENGPASALTYLKGLAARRDGWRGDVRLQGDLVVENERVLVEGLMRTKTALTLTLAASSLLPPMGVVYLTYEISWAIAENWDQGIKATAIAVAKELAEEAVGRIGGKIVAKAAKKVKGLAKSIQESERSVEKAGRALETTTRSAGRQARKARKTVQRRLERYTEKLHDLRYQEELAKTEWLFGQVMNSFDFLFVGLDMKEAIREYQQHKASD